LCRCQGCLKYNSTPSIHLTSWVAWWQISRPVFYRWLVRISAGTPTILLRKFTWSSSVQTNSGAVTGLYHCRFEIVSISLSISRPIIPRYMVYLFICGVFNDARLYARSAEPCILGTDIIK
jgi:hypothetical protein